MICWGPHGHPRERRELPGLPLHDLEAGGPVASVSSRGGGLFSPSDRHVGGVASRGELVLGQRFDAPGAGGPDVHEVLIGLDLDGDALRQAELALNEDGRDARPPGVVRGRFRVDREVLSDPPVARLVGGTTSGL